MASAKKDETTGVNEQEQKVLAALDKAGNPVGTKEIAGEAGLDDKAVTKAIKSLKTDGYIDSPVRCKYVITSEGKKALTL